MPRKKSSSIWYPRYIGDYKRKTSHLSMAEHGAYAMLMDHYYSTGKALPTSVPRLKRICSAFEDHEVDAMNTILIEFFILQTDEYHHERADEELVKRKDISAKRKAAVEARYEKGRALEGTNVPPLVPTTTVTPTSIEEEQDIVPSELLFDLPINIDREAWGSINGNSSAEIADAVFEKWFWPLYPDRKGPKRPALLKFRGALKHDNAASILFGLSHYARKREDESKPEFTKHAVTWLNQRGWQDEVREFEGND